MGRGGRISIVESRDAHRRERYWRRGIRLGVVAGAASLCLLFLALTGASRDGATVAGDPPRALPGRSQRQVPALLTVPPEPQANDTAGYPPQSWPATPARAQAFAYNRRDLQFLPAISPDGKSAAFYSAFTADKMMVFEGESITLSLRAARRAAAAASNLTIDVEAAGLSKGRRSEAPTVMGLTFRDDGGAGDRVADDGIYTAIVTPSETALRDFHGSVRAFVRYSADGTSFGHQLFFNYYPTKGIAGRLSGRFREGIEDGSLVVYASIDVQEAGFFTIDANLLDANDLAFAHARFKGALERGAQEVRLLFFGKVIRDAQPPPPSPFRVAEIYGHMVPSPQHLAELAARGDFAPSAVPLYSGSFRTRSYQVGDFSAAPHVAANP